MPATKIQLVLEGQDQASAVVKKVNAEVAALGTTTATTNTQLAAPVAASATAAAKATTSFKQLGQATQATRAGMNAMRGAVVLLGGQAFPQLTGAVFASTAALQGMRGAALATGASFSVVAVAAAGLIAALATVTESYRLLNATRTETASRLALDSQAVVWAGRLRDTIADLVKVQKLSGDEAERLLNILSSPTPERVSLVRQQIAPLIGTEKQEGRAKEIIADVSQLTLDLVKESLEGSAAEVEAARQTFRQRLTELEDQRAEIVAMRNILPPAVFDNAIQNLNTALVFAARSRDKALADAQKSEDEALRKQNEAAAQSAAQRVQADLKAQDEIEAIRGRVTQAALEGSEQELAAIDERYDREIERVRELVEELGLGQEAEDELNDAIQRGRDAEKEAINARDRKQEAEKRIATERQVGDAIVDIMGSTADAARLLGKEGFMAWKAIAIAQAIVSTALAVVRALAEGGPYAGPFLAAAAAAAGAVQIATIAATQPQGFSGGGFTGFGGKHEPAGVVHKGEVVIPAWRVEQIGLQPALQFALGKSAPAAPAPQFSFAQGGLVTGAGAAQNFNFALIDDRQSRREWEARQGMKVVIGQLRKRGNAISL